jgi:hypothetical protein
MGITRLLGSALLIVLLLGMFIGALGSDPQGFVNAQTAPPVPVREEGAVAVIVAHYPKTVDSRYTLDINLIAPSLGEEGKHITIQCSQESYRRWRDGDNILVKAIFQGAVLKNVALRTEGIK